MTNKPASVEIYYSQMCGLCHEAMDYFKQNNIDFNAYEVEWKNDGWVDSENSRRMSRHCGEVSFVPQFLINGKHIEGWKTLKPMIDSGELKSLLEECGSEDRAAKSLKAM